MTDPVAGIADTRGHYRRQRSLYADDLTHFLGRSPESILGLLAGATGFPVTLAQRFAWTEQIELLRDALNGLEGRGRIYFEYAIPRLGKWIDVLLVLDHVVFVIEFKVGETLFNRAAIDQVWDYALDLRNFHETSHGIPIAPMLVATKAKSVILGVVLRANDPLMPEPVCAGATQIRAAITHILELLTGPTIDPDTWERGRYQPTPTIIEAARALARTVREGTRMIAKGFAPESRREEKEWLFHCDDEQRRVRRKERASAALAGKWQRTVCTSRQAPQSLAATERSGHFTATSRNVRAMRAIRSRTFPAATPAR